MLTSTMLVILMTIPAWRCSTAAWPAEEHAVGADAGVRHLLADHHPVVRLRLQPDLRGRRQVRRFGFDKVFLKGITADTLSGLLPTIPEFVFVAFQSTFAAITCALIVGSFAERIKFSAVLLFSVIWFTFSYIPMAHMVWGGGLLGARRAGLRRRHRGAHQRRYRRSGGCLRGGQAHRLRQGIAGTAQPD
jgi:Amt family ammonium transporter